MNQEIQKLREIYNVVESNDNPSIGLFSGSAGELLFLANYNGVFNDNRSKELLNKKLEDTYSILNERKVLYSFCGGLAGLGWTLNILKENNLADIDTSEFSEVFDPIIFGSSLLDVKRNYYDYLHGGFGTILYAIDNKTNHEANEFLKNITNAMLDIATITDEYCYWTDDNFLKKTSKDQIIINLGFAHGNSGIINLMIELYDATKDDRLPEVIEKGINFLLSTKLDAGKNSMFPTTAGSEEQSRLGWCYGDLGFALTFLKAGKVFNKDSWRNQAIEIAQFNCNRKDLSKNAIYEGGICHGSAGLTLFFKEFYEETSDNKFLDVADFWHKHTLAFGRFADGAAGYKSKWEQGWRVDKNLLSGSSGIGLALLNQIEGSVLNWQKSLLYN